MAQFDKAFTQFTQANVPGQFQQGRQFTQQNQQAAQQQAQSQFNLDQSRKLAPINLEQQQAQLTGSQQLNEKRDRVAVLTRNLDTVLQLKATPDNQKAEFLTSKIAEGEAKGRDMTESMKALELVNQGRFEELAKGGDQLISIGERSGIISREGGARSAGQQEFESLIADFSDEDKVSARRRKAGLEARAVGSSSITTATTEGLTAKVAESEGALSEAKESGKQRSQLKFKPQIVKAVSLAEAEAKERGEVLTDIKRAEAALPGLNESVAQLRELATIATSTIGGKIFDAAVKETGFGSTKGATAKAKFIAIINNQVLPLLKPTFGAAFTVQEGESLKATMGDPDASPEQKMAQLDAFIEQKMRDIRSKKAQVGDQSGGLSTDEQAELEALRAELGV